MNVAPAHAFRPSAVGQVEAGEVRAQQTPIPALGNAPTGEGQPSRSAPVVTLIPQDVVKVQMKPPGEIVVYQFMDQQGTVVLQVPPQQMIELAQQIAQELAPKPPPPTAPEGGTNNGH